jgi:hypothetical protein
MWDEEKKSVLSQCRARRRPWPALGNTVVEIEQI